MRYLFRGLIRDTGKVVEGHVESATEEAAFNTLAENGIVTESLRSDPKPLSLNDELPDAPRFANALDSAFDSSSMQVPFDELTEKYRGKRVWVIDRDKIRRRVAQVVDSALTQADQNAEGAAKMRERVANAIQGLFNDNRNIASERMAGPGMRPVAPGGAAQSFAPQGMPSEQPIGPSGSAGLEEQIGRIAGLVRQAEVALAAIQIAARSGGFGGGGGGPRRRALTTARPERQNEVLLEIFKSNLELQRGETLPTAPAVESPSPAAMAAPTPDSGEMPT